MRDLFLSQQAVHRFLGYMDSQHERMMGRGKRNRVPNRPELIAKYGWDVKYGSHALRLALEGYELVSTGRLTLPLPQSARDLVLDVKHGKYPRDEVSTMVQDFRSAIEDRLRMGAGLPPKPDMARISEWAVSAQRRHWGWL